MLSAVRYFIPLMLVYTSYTAELHLPSEAHGVIIYL